MSQFLNILFASLAVLLLSKEIKAGPNGLILAFVKSIVNFNHFNYGESAFMEYIDVAGPGSDFPVLEGQVAVNYSNLTSEPKIVIYPFHNKWIGVTKVELRFEKHAGDVRAHRLICASGHSPDDKYLVVQVPWSREPDNLIVKVYAKYWIDYHN